MGKSVKMMPESHLNELVRVVSDELDKYRVEPVDRFDVNDAMSEVLLKFGVFTLPDEELERSKGR